MSAHSGSASESATATAGEERTRYNLRGRAAAASRGQAGSSANTGGSVRDTSRSRSRERDEAPPAPPAFRRSIFKIPFDPYPENTLLRPMPIPRSWEEDPTERRDTSLHNACKERQSNSFARRMLEISPPHDVFVKDNDFHTPLFYALHNGLAHDVCMSMIELWRTWGAKHGPDWAEAHRDVGLVGAACSTRCSVDTFREVLVGTEAYPNPTGTAMEHDYGHRPLEILWSNFLNELRNRVVLARATRRGKQLLTNDTVRMLLQKTSLVLEALEHSTTSPKPGSTKPFIPSQAGCYHERLVHLSVEYCDMRDRSGRVLVPFDFLYLLFRVFPEQLLQYDVKGRMPLHIALCMNGAIVVNIVSDLVRICPRAASALDGNHRTPLSLAIESGRPSTSKIVGALLSAAPNALSTRDVKTHLFPFMLAASRPEVSEEESVLCVGASYSDIQTIYELLRASPDQVQGGCV